MPDSDLFHASSSLGMQSISDADRNGLSNWLATESAGSFRTDILKSIFVWPIVCSIAAIPSWTLAPISARRDHYDAMIWGIVVFSVLYIWVDLATRHLRFRAFPSIRQSIRIVFGIRILMSIVYPLGVSVDLPGGLIAARLASLFGYQRIEASIIEPQVVLNFADVFVWTLMQGVVLNFVLFLVWGIVAFLLWGVRKLNSPFSPSDADFSPTPLAKMSDHN